MKEKYGDERVSKYILLRPNQDQLRKMQLQGLLAGNWTRDPGLLDQTSALTDWATEAVAVSLATSSVYIYILW